MNFPSPPSVVPELSPAYLSAADAARHGHRHIAEKPDQGSSVLILSDGEGRYFATLPQLSNTAGKNHPGFPEVDAMQPDGLQVAGSVFSHGTSVGSPKLTSTEQLLRKNLFSVQDIAAVLKGRAGGRELAIYLSTPEGALLCYTPTRSVAEQALSLRVFAPGGGHSELEQALDAGTLKPLDWVRLLAQAGGFHVVSGSALWGAAGPVEISWVPSANRVGGLARRAMPPCSRIFPTLAGALVFSVQRSQKRKQQHPLAFILENPLLGGFVATWATEDKAPFFALETVFPLHSDGQARLPTGWSIQGLFYAAPQESADRAPKKNWLLESLFAPIDLAAAIDRTKPLRTATQAQTPCIHMMTWDGAVLSYRSRQSAEEVTLLGDARQRRDELESGALSPDSYLQRLARAGDFRVEVASVLWDRPGPLTPGWKPFSMFEWPDVGPTFLQIDDAMRYASREIYGKADKYRWEYGVMVFQQQDGMYVATRPLRGESEAVDIRLFLPKDSTGQLIAPDNTEFVAVLHNHPRPITDPARQQWKQLVEAVKANPAVTIWSSPEYELFTNVFSVSDLANMLGNPILPPLCYLLGPDKGLISYRRTGSAAEDRLFFRIQGPAGNINDAINSELGQLIGKQHLTPSDLIRLCAEAGELRVVMGNRMWGGKGRLSVTWQVGVAAANVVNVESADLGPVYGKLDSAMEYARERSLRASEQKQFGYVLADSGNQRYLATDPIAFGDTGLSMDQVFPQQKGGGHVLPDGFRVVGMYACAALVPAVLPPLEQVILKQFLAPKDLQLALVELRRLKTAEADPVLPLFIVARDGALLTYRMTGSGPGNLHAQHLALMNRQLRMSDCIREWASAGELSVERRSELWDRSGRVDAQWVPYADLQARRFTPMFATADDAARYVQALIGRRQDTLYGGLIFQLLDQHFVATLPLAFDALAVDAAQIFPSEWLDKAGYPQGCAIVAVYQSRLVDTERDFLENNDPGLYSSLFSPPEFHTLYKDRNWAASRYLCGPDNSLIRYTCSDSALERALATRCAPPSVFPEQVRGSEMEKALRSEDVTPEEWARLMAAVGDLQVLSGNALLGEPGKVMPGWKVSAPVVNDPLYPRPRAQPLCSTVFSQAFDAVRQAGDWAGSSAGTQFGFILRKPGTSEFLCTRPVEDKGAYFARERVFPDGISLHEQRAGFVIHGVCLFAPNVNGGDTFLDEKAIPAKLDELYPHFVSPLDLALVLDAYRGKPVYLFPARGGVLSYNTDKTARDVLGGEASVIRDQITKTQTMSARQYIRRVATMGQLEVLVRGGIWSVNGTVSRYWESSTPNTITAKLPARLGFSPLFYEADDAARWVHQRIGDKRTSKLMGMLLKKNQYNAVVALDPLLDRTVLEEPDGKLFLNESHERETGNLRPLPLLPEGYWVEGVYYSHSTEFLNHKVQLIASGAGDEIEAKVVEQFFQTGDICYVSGHLKRFGFTITRLYLSTGGGALLSYSPQGTPAEKALCQRPKGAAWNLDEGDELKRQMETRTLRPSGYVSRVAEAGELRVVEAAGVWSGRGVVAKGWSPATQVSGPPRVERPSLP